MTGKSTRGPGGLRIRCARIPNSPSRRRRDRPAAARRDEIKKAADGHVATEGREARGAHTCGRQEGDAGDGGEAAADENRHLAGPAEREDELEGAGDDRPGTEGDQRGAGVGGDDGPADTDRGDGADRCVDAERSRAWAGCGQWRS
jgi:hypothetical protein